MVFHPLLLYFDSRLFKTILEVLHYSINWHSLYYRIFLTSLAFEPSKGSRSFINPPITMNAWTRIKTAIKTANLVYQIMHSVFKGKFTYSFQYSSDCYPDCFKLSYNSVYSLNFITPCITLLYKLIFNRFLLLYP